MEGSVKGREEGLLERDKIVKNLRSERERRREREKDREREEEIGR